LAAIAQSPERLQAVRQGGAVTTGPHRPNHPNNSNNSNKGVAMNIHLTLGPLVALIAGILILIVPRLLNYIVALYLIIIGLIGLFGVGGTAHL
jgi:hypothetical protein